MWLLIVEACIALGMLVFIVWWTMSSRRRDVAPAVEVDQADAVARVDDPSQTPGEDRNKPGPG